MNNYTVYTCIFGPYEPLKEPLVVTYGWTYLCITDQDFKSDVWEIRKVNVYDARLTARFYKSLAFKDLSRFTLWVDGSFTINTDLNEFWNKYFVSPFSCPSHPMRSDVFDEIDSAIEGQRGGLSNIEKQRERYKETVPRNGGIITSGILLRENTVECIDLCVNWWKETSRPESSLRDQVSFAFASINYKHIIHTFNYRYAERMEFLYTPHSSKTIGDTTHF